MQNHFVRLAALGIAVVAVLSCDGGVAAPRFGNGIQGGPTGTAPITPPNPSSPDTNRPFTRLDTPSVGQLVNVGDSILTVVRINDDRQIASLTLIGFDYSGDPNLGTFQATQRYSQVIVPTGTNFRAGLVDTTLRRYLKPALPLDTTVDSLVIMAISRDAAGNADTLTRRVNIVTGPKLSIVAPPSGDSVPQGFGMVVRVRAQHADGVASMVIRATHPPSWPTRISPDSFIVAFSATAPVRDTIHSVTFNIPNDAVLRSTITISASAVDVNRNPGSTPPLNVIVRAAGSLPPRVYQVVPGRLEFGDSIQVTAAGDGITQVGLILRDTAGNVIPGGDTVTFVAPFASNVVQKLALNLSLADQGQRIGVQSFAVDANSPTPRIGYSLQQGTTTPITSAASAFTDTALVAYGRTFALPRNGVAGDVAVDVLRGNVFVSNTDFNLVEVWNNTTKTFTPSGVQVGALPWGLFVSNNPDTLLVANSGATTVSRVCIGNCASGIREDLARRIRTRNTTIFQVNWTRDEVTGKIKIARLADVSYSDRPQYIAQSEGGRLFFSTRPTPSAPDGTLRWLDPAFLTPDPRQVWQYGRILPGDQTVYSIFHADSIRIGATPNNSTIADTLYIYDHVYGGTAPIVVADSLPVRAGNNIVLAGGDVETVLNLDVASLALTDTTFVSASGDRRWIGFGEGATPGTGRLTMVNDPPGVAPIFFSPGITVTDLVHNANERIFGMALDSTGLQVTAHGLQTYVAAMDNPFHMRLDGVYDSFDNGAGVAFHPRANGTNTVDPNNRVLFTATSSGVVEIVDIAHYNNRGRLITKGNFYGPLRASVPLPGDAAAGIVLKLYGLSDQGLVVIDLRASDIRPAP